MASMATMAADRQPGVVDGPMLERVRNMTDLVFVVVIIAAFALLALIVRGAEKL